VAVVSAGADVWVVAWVVGGCCVLVGTGCWEGGLDGTCAAREAVAVVWSVRAAFRRCLSSSCVMPAARYSRNCPLLRRFNNDQPIIVEPAQATYSMMTSVGALLIGQNADRYPASWDPKIKRRRIVLACRRGAICRRSASLSCFNGWKQSYFLILEI